MDLNHGDFEVLEILNYKEIYIEYNSDVRKFLVFPHHSFMEEHFSKIMSILYWNGACMTHFIAGRQRVTGAAENWYFDKVCIKGSFSKYKA